MGNPYRFHDRMVMKDDLDIINHIDHNSECAAPHGRLFQILGRNPKTGNRVVKEIACNTVVVGGAIRALENLTGLTAEWEPGTINSIRGISATSNATPVLALFGIGTGGANLDFGSVIDPDIKQRDLRSAIPMRYTEVLSGDDADKYFLKTDAQNPDGTFSWWGKRFTGVPIIKTCWKNSTDPDEDGTEVTSEIYDSKETTGLETFCEVQVDLGIKDGREYFQATGQLDTARYNEMAFYTGSLNDAGTEYAKVRLYSTISFNNKDLVLKTKSSFLYRIYSLI